jgi:hypothetical protein
LEIIGICIYLLANVFMLLADCLEDAPVGARSDFGFSSGFAIGFAASG